MVVNTREKERRPSILPESAYAYVYVMTRYGGSVCSGDAHVVHK